MLQYIELIEDIQHNGRFKGDRTGTGTVSVFGRQLRFDLQKGFPLVTVKKTHLKSIIHELLWFLKGDTNIKYLNDNGVRIWDEWADDRGELGPIYSKMWRSWPTRNGETIDQIQRAIDTLRTTPTSRRIIVTGWNPEDLPDTQYSPKENASMGKQALPPCHTLFQFYVEELTAEERIELGHYKKAEGPKYRLSCQLYQRSADCGLGLPFNIASYALLTMMVAQVTGMVPGEFIHTLGDAHIYSNHFDQIDEMLQRYPRPLPTMKLNPGVKEIDDFTYDDFTLEGYNPHPKIDMPVSV